MKKWIITADIIGSRKIEKRKKFQQDLENVLDEINSRFVDSLGNKFRITLGDQFSGAVNNPAVLLELILELIYQLRSVSLRFGIAYGEVEGNSDGVLTGGRGYELSLQMVKDAAEKEFPVCFNITAYQNKFIKYLIMIIIFCFVYYFNKFTERQRQIMYYLLQGWKQLKIAEKVNISQSAVSQAVTNINWTLFRKVYNIFPDIFSLNYRRNSILRLFDADYIAFIGFFSSLREEELLKQLLNDINEQYGKEIESDFVITVPGVGEAGYEFQGLVKNRTKIFDILTDIYAVLDDVFLAVGMGSISTALKKQALGMDGPAFYRAREALEKTSKDMPIFISGQEENKHIYYYISCVFSFVLLQINRWTKKQLGVINLRRKGLIQQQIASKLNISQSGVVDHLSRAGWKEYDYLNNVIYHLLNI